MARARERVHEVFAPNQLLGRNLSIGCTAVEITQRCNLDCTLCYLSEHSESVQDLPIEEVFARLDRVRAEYGPGTSVQITGGDPTLRKHVELIEIVRHAREIGLYPALFTNGIAASRRLLQQLTDVGLCDVAFHVDTTQRRAGYSSESSLNPVRLEYLERVRGLPLTVLFNTTVHDGNLAELPALVRFFRGQARYIGMVSFQLQAQTGRGEWGASEDEVSLANVERLIEQEIHGDVSWNPVAIGHPDCHSYLPALVVGDSAYPLIPSEQRGLVESFVRDFVGANTDRREGFARVVLGYALAFVRRPDWWLRGARFALATGWRLRKAWLRRPGRIDRLSFFLHNFMDAESLDTCRVDACSFMLMTADGPVSMCKHNAMRDDYILKPIRFVDRNGNEKTFEPLAAGRRQSGRQASAQAG